MEFEGLHCVGTIDILLSLVMRSRAGYIILSVGNLLRRCAHVYCIRVKFWKQGFMLFNANLLSGRSAMADRVEG